MNVFLFLAVLLGQQAYSTRDKLHATFPSCCCSFVLASQQPTSWPMSALALSRMGSSQAALLPAQGQHAFSLKQAAMGMGAGGSQAL